MTTEKAQFEILSELMKSRAKHPEFPSDTIHQAAVVNAESGLLMNAAIQLNLPQSEAGIDRWSEEIQRQAIRTAAMCFRLLETFENPKL